MKRAISLCVIALVLLAGCQTPRTRLRTAFDSYTATVEAMTLLVEQDVLTKEQALEFDKWREMARVSLNEWHNAVQAGDSPSEAVKRFWDAHRELVNLRLDVEGRNDE